MRSQRNFSQGSLSLAILLSLLGGIPVALAMPQQTANSIRYQKADVILPTVPPTPPPPGKRQPGGGLSGEALVCPPKQQALTALTPASVHGVTLSEKPTFWFYMPYTSEEVASGEFSILTWDEEQRVYETAFELPDTAGLVSITLPDSEEFNLQEDVPYHWYVNLNCDSNTDSKSELKIDGWVQRIAHTPERRQQVSSTSPDIWYDAVAQLAAQLQDPALETAVLRQTWTELLESVDLGDLAPAPIVGPVRLEPIPSPSE